MTEVGHQGMCTKPHETKTKAESMRMLPKSRSEGRVKRSEKTEEMRRRILEESIRLFMEQGYEKTTTRQIIQGVGILNGSLYNIYKSKEAIFTDIILMSLDVVMSRAYRHIPEDSDKIDLLTYLMCMEIYLSKRSKRIAELLCIVNENWSIRKKVDETVINWARANSAMGNLYLGLDEPLMRLDACSGATFIFIERLANEPEDVNEAAAMAIAVETVDALFHRPASDVAARVSSLISSFSSEEIVICGLRIL